MSQIDTPNESEAKASTVAIPAESVAPAPADEPSLFHHLIVRILRPNVRQGLVVLVDQGFYSITNFLTAILVARTCSKEEFGFYVLGLTLLMTLLIVQRSLVSTPFVVYSPHLKTHDHDAYFGSTLIHHLSISGIASVGFALAAGVLYLTRRGQGMDAVLIALSLGSVPILLRDFMRYVLLADLRFWTSLLMGLAANLATVIALFWIYVNGWLTAPVAYLVMAGCSGPPAAILIFSKRKHLSIVKNRLVSDIIKDWHFGRWLLAASGATTIGVQTIPWFVLLWCGADSVAVFGALMSVAGIIRPAILGVAAYLTPKLAHHLQSAGLAATIKIGLKVIRTMSVFVVAYIVFMLVLGDEIVGVFYTARYQGYLIALAIIATGTGLAAHSTTLKALVRAIGKPEIEFWSSVYASIVCVLASIFLIPRFGIVGAAMAMTTWNATFAVTTRLRVAWITEKSVTSRDIQHEAIG